MKKIINNIWDKMIYIYDIFNSIKIISNPTANFAIKIAVLLIGFLIIRAVLKSIFRPKTDTYYPPIQPELKQPKQYTPTLKTIDECISEDDLKFQMAQAEEEILNVIKKNKEEIKDTLRKANQTIDTSWLDSCNKILRVSNTLNNNLTYYGHKNLETSKFQYYANLHFRSMIAANIVYSEYEKIDKSFTEINNFIVRMKSHPEFRGNYKTQVHGQKDQIKSIRNLSLNQVHSMNHETAILRDKIGSECGERGRKWWIDRKRHEN